ncbi:unnamed protein product [Phytophthora lilii]|uniref:Unnamed protein product n=1 Tax=Phytophthora lilii TaxID=2077276 RepID=A0A9W6TFE9_9STRA|nr:unnamed protein product [Phytophthora lilii]
MEHLARICDAKLKVEDDTDVNDESFKLAVPKRDIASAARKPCGGEHQPRKGISGRRSAFAELEMSPNEEPSRFEHHFTHMSGKKYGPYGSHAVEAVEGLMQEFDEMDELSQEQPESFYAPLLQRQYFHSRTGAVVLDHEKDYDSDDDVDETWITKQSERVGLFEIALKRSFCLTFTGGYLFSKDAPAENEAKVASEQAKGEEATVETPATTTITTE